MVISAWRARVRRFVRTPEGHLITQTLVFKSMLLLLGICMLAAVAQQRTFSLDLVEYILKNWDARHYQTIATNGYVPTGPDRFLLFYFPLYPVAIKMAAFVIGNYALSALLVSALASLGAVVMLYKLAALDVGKKQASRAVWWLLVFPTAYFLHAAYTEGLFLLLALGAWYFYRKKNWQYAATFGFLAGMTRLTAVALLATLAAEYFIDHHKSFKKITWKPLVTAATPALGIAVYLFINWQVSGDPLKFLDYQKENWYRTFDYPWMATYRLIVESVSSNKTLMEVCIGYWAELAAVVTMVGAAIWSWQRLRKSYFVWIVVQLLMVTSSTFLTSMPRYALVALVPLYILLGKWQPESLKYQCLSYGFILLQVAFWFLYVRGIWAF